MGEPQQGEQGMCLGGEREDSFYQWVRGTDSSFQARGESKSIFFVDFVASEPRIGNSEQS